MRRRNSTVTFSFEKEERPSAVVAVKAVPTAQVVMDADLVGVSIRHASVGVSPRLDTTLASALATSASHPACATANAGLSGSSPSQRLRKA